MNKEFFEGMNPETQEQQNVNQEQNQIHSENRNENQNQEEPMTTPQETMGQGQNLYNQPETVVQGQYERPHYEYQTPNGETSRQ